MTSTTASSSIPVGSSLVQHCGNPIVGIEGVVDDVEDAGTEVGGVEGGGTGLGGAQSGGAMRVLGTAVAAYSE